MHNHGDQGNAASTSEARRFDTSTFTFYVRISDYCRLPV